MTRVYGTILKFHHKKTGGRYHLLLQALQGLLHCLYTPYQLQMSQPPWITSASVRLGRDSAMQLSRLLTSLSEPTSSVARKHKKNRHRQLNDDTKRSRNIAGQYLQYFVMEFCACQLHGQLDTEARSQLDPGLWAIMGAMTEGLMTSVNAALDAPRRAVFKTLYDDYRKFGR